MRSVLSVSLLFIFLSAFCTHAWAQDDEIISVDSSIVVVNTTVADGSGRAITGLKKDLFSILEDGVEQQLASFTAEETPFAAVILVDTSGSMEERVVLARSAAIQFLDNIRRDDFVAIYNFDSKVRLVQDFSNSRDIRDAAYELKAKGMTVLNDAIYKAVEELNRRAEKRRAVVVLSDGADTASRKGESEVLRAALAAGVTVYTVDMAAQISGPRTVNLARGSLKKFADQTGGRFLATPGGQSMRDAFRSIAEELGAQYTLTYEPAASKKDGKWHSIEVRVARPNLTIRARKGYNAPRK